MVPQEHSLAKGNVQQSLSVNLQLFHINQALQNSLIEFLNFHKAFHFTSREADFCGPLKLHPRLCGMYSLKEQHRCGPRICGPCVESRHVFETASLRASLRASYAI